MRALYAVHTSLSIFLMIMWCLATPANGGAFLHIKEQREIKSRAILEDVAVWFIEEGLSEYYKSKDLSVIKNGVVKRGAHLYAYVSFNKFGYLVSIVPELFWVRSTVTCYSRVKTDSGLIYEYWVFDRFGGTRSDVDREIYFAIARSKGLDKKREIIRRTEKFFSEFTTPDGVVIRFPMDNDASVFGLRPWKYPNAFKDTELEGVKIEINEDGKYIRKRIP